MKDPLVKQKLQAPPLKGAVTAGSHAATLDSGPGTVRDRHGHVSTRGLGLAGPGAYSGPLVYQPCHRCSFKCTDRGGDKDVILRDSLQEGCSDSVVNTHPTESPKMAFWLHWRHCVHTTLGVPPWCT